jgi:O-antigen/teichoic acid export membrane protein
VGSSGVATDARHHVSQAGATAAAPIDGRVAAKGSVALLFSQAATRSVQLLFVLVATRMVSPDQFGRFSVAAGMLVLGGLLADLGTAPALVRLASREPEQTPDVLGGTLAASFGLGVVGWVAIAFMASLVYDHTVMVDATIMAASLPFYAMNTSIHAALDGTGRIPVRAKAMFVQPLVAAGVASAVVAYSHDIRLAMWCTPIAAAAASAVGIAVASRSGLLRLGVRPVPHHIGKLLRLAIPFALLSGLGSLSARFDLLLLGAIDGTAASASYDLALRTCETLWYVHTIVTAPTMVLLSHRLGSGDVAGARRAYDMAIRISYISGFAVALVVAVASPAIIDLLGGHDYAHASAALAISASVLWLGYVSFVQGTLILAGDHLKAGLVTAGILTAITIAIDIALIMAFGVIGAACAAALAVIATVIGCAVLHRRTLGWSTAPPQPRLLVVAIVALAAAIPALHTPLLAGVIAMSVYVVGLGIARVVDSDDLALAKTLLRRAA